MGSTSAYLSTPYYSNAQSVRVVRADNNYIRKVELDISAVSHMNYGWDSVAGINTSYGGGQTGKRVIWDYSDNPTLTANVYPLAMVHNTISGYYGANYTKTRDGNLYKIKHQSNHGSSTSFENSYPNAPKPTFSISMSNDSVISLNKNTTYTYDDWFRTAENGEACAQKSITVYKKPYIADQTMTVTSSTTPNMYYPENSSQYVILKQPKVYSSIGITDDTTTMDLTSYSSMSPLWGSGFTYDFYVKILVYKPDWDSLSDIEMSWNVTGAKASQCSVQSGTITDFNNLTNATGSWVDYAVGYFPFTYSVGSSLASTDLNFNVVANGLKFDSGTQTKTVSAYG